MKRSDRSVADNGFEVPLGGGGRIGGHRVDHSIGRGQVAENIESRGKPYHLGWKDRWELARVSWEFISLFN
jgi:hypothetical protein